MNHYIRINAAFCIYFISSHLTIVASNCDKATSVAIRTILYGQTCNIQCHASLMPKKDSWRIKLFSKKDDLLKEFSSESEDVIFYSWFPTSQSLAYENRESVLARLLEKDAKLFASISDDGSKAFVGKFIEQKTVYGVFCNFSKNCLLLIESGPLNSIKQFLVESDTCSECCAQIDDYGAISIFIESKKPQNLIYKRALSTVLKWW